HPPEDETYPAPPPAGYLAYRKNESPSSVTGRRTFAAHTTALLLHDAHGHNPVARTDCIDNIESFDHFAETRMYPVEVLRVLPVAADEELRAARVPAAVRHGQHASVMVLPRCIGFELDGITGPSRTIAHPTSALYDESRYHAVEREPVVKSALGQLDEILSRSGRLPCVEFGFHVALLRTDNSVCHNRLLVLVSVTVRFRSRGLRLRSIRSPLPRRTRPA